MMSETEAPEAMTAQPEPHGPRAGAPCLLSQVAMGQLGLLRELETMDLARRYARRNAPGIDISQLIGVTALRPPGIQYAQRSPFAADKETS